MDVSARLQNCLGLEGWQLPLSFEPGGDIHIGILNLRTLPMTELHVNPSRFDSLQDSDPTLGWPDPRVIDSNPNWHALRRGVGAGKEKARAGTASSSKSAFGRRRIELPWYPGHRPTLPKTPGGSTVDGRRQRGLTIRHGCGDLSNSTALDIL